MPIEGRQFRRGTYKMDTNDKIILTWCTVNRYNGCKILKIQCITNNIWD